LQKLILNWNINKEKEEVKEDEEGKEEVKEEEGEGGGRGEGGGIGEGGGGNSFKCRIYWTAFSRNFSYKF
jgi:hypothetical protein